MMFRLIAVVSAAVAAALMVAAPAQADDQSYLNYLEAHGQSTTAFPYSPGKFVMVGHMICTNLHSGADPLAGASPIDRATWGPIGVEAAQHELCPDTLPR
jgi:poly(3-hydroxybutyrate) depolymerase